MCSPKEMHKPLGTNSCGCGIFIRQFVSKKEQQECLEKYRKQLENEIAGITERIQELKGK